ncbi:DUF484 family protein [Aquisalimonas sp.]|uniref:DUF484 family protein n=1 Tax=Aquisalimonas sp. TaxID=1872621 RepID=UPI0025BAC3AA|nr:DUF484 family protein [Aquisalimonas sp.]
MTSQNSAGLDDTLPEEAVAAYLQRDPEFFMRHPALATGLRIRHECGEATSLITYQMNRLRHDNRQLQHRLDEMLQVARDNDRLAERLHRITLELMDSQDLDGLLLNLKAGLQNQFRPDLVAIALFPLDGERGGQEILAPEERPAFAAFLQTGQPRLGQLDAEQGRLLFGDAAEHLGSAAVVPISDNHQVTGILAVGSFEAERFNPSQGTVFLRQLGQLAGRALRAYRTPATP